MLFSSVIFIFFFLPAVLFSYYILPKKIKNIVLLLFSLFFYAYGEPKYVIVMIFSIIINYILGILIDIYRENKKVAKLILFLTFIINILIIGYYKYTNFIIENVNMIFNVNISKKNILMPIGISFFTFQGLSYVVDVYRRDGEVQKNPLNVALYISFFPQLIAGPIVRYQSIAKQINNRKENIGDFAYGIERFLLGLSKKVILANTVGLIADEIFSTSIGNLSIVSSWIGIISYSLQIYFDFSGYSDMAIGLGRMFGFVFEENFNYPYMSKSVTEFWRRWHISLGTWFRDYVYIPLGGNKCSKLKYIRNIFIVWFLTGLWHGASWNFIIWGLYYGIILFIEKILFAKYFKKGISYFQHFYTILLVMIGWVFFRAETFKYSIEYLKVLFGISNNTFLSLQAVYYLNEYKFELILSVLCALPIYPWIKRKIKQICYKKVIVFDFICYYIKPAFLMVLFFLSIIYLINSTFNPFIYFRF